MAARPHRFLLLPVLLLLLSASSASANGDVVTAASRKVNMALYYESLCPFSEQFVVNSLARVFKDGLLDAADLTLVPYGNAKVDAHGAITCQHGPDECLLNNVEACAIEAWPDLNVHFGFINCVEDLVMNRKREEWQSCFQKQGLDPKPVMECYNSEHGHKLSLKYGKQTDALVPPHKYVPWVVVDGEPLYEDYENFEAYVCKAYKGHPPKICQGLGRDYPIVQQVVEVGNGVTYNSGDFELDDKIKMVSADGN
ncbi:gamma-interferon-responsive lysosomal thiol protein-like isoform X1 [Hordeum vulgare subsp. vulgare]|uniref:gamma-interferon-responsive lysosomal thiol protein-like isoform X1 n=1 Tax=Hordeum vulgare subsp. vulgare TaxID=112509 RepID=UPI000294F983|nr:gamma-interferon-responsive lysosomal thiol protein-like isoform X1 [Hordeum vulgare subsp. vulgare]